MNLNPYDVLSDFEPHLEKGFEWINDRAVEKAMGAESSVVSTRLTTRLDRFAEANDLGLVFNMECGYQCFPGKPRQVRKPDGSFIAKGRLPNDKVPRGNVTIAPDLAIEVISPNDIAEDFEVRVDELISAGVRLLWIIYPRTRSAWVLRKDGTAARLTEMQELSGEDVVPGFTCPLSSLFQGL